VYIKNIKTVQMFTNIIQENKDTKDNKDKDKDNLGESEKQRQKINHEACVIYQDVYEYVEKI
jgi:hypothetical protein